MVRQPNNEMVRREENKCIAIAYILILFVQYYILLLKLNVCDLMNFTISFPCMRACSPLLLHILQQPSFLTEP